MRSSRVTVKGAADGRSSKIFVPIDVVAVAERFAVDADISFGGLYITSTRNTDPPSMRGRCPSRLSRAMIATV
jgi:hypothetical protein